MIELAVDAETYYDSRISLSKLAAPIYIHRTHIHGIAVYAPPKPAYWETDLDRFKKAFDWGQVRLISHTWFDQLLLHLKLGITPAEYVDTAGLARAFLGKSLDSTLKRLMPLFGAGEKGLELVESKGVQKLSESLSERIGNYAINDVMGCWAIYKALWPHLPKNERRIMSLQGRMSVIPTLQIDLPTIEAGLEELVAERDSIIKTSGYSIAELRSAAFKDIVQAITGGYPSKLNDKGQTIPAFAKNDVEYQNYKADHPEASALFAAKEAAQSTTDITRAQTIIEIGKTIGRMPMMTKYYGAKTGRASGDGGINVQNLKRGSATRRCLYAPEGYEVLVADSSQIELRVNAWFCDEQHVLDVLTQPDGDVYAHAARLYYKRPITKATDPNARQFGKCMTLGLGYGMGFVKFRNVCAVGFMGAPPIYMTPAEAKLAVDTWRAGHPHITQMWERLQQTLGLVSTGKTAEYKAVTITKDGIQLPNGMAVVYPNLSYNTQLNAWTFGIDRFETLIGAKVLENIIQSLARIIVFDQMLAIDDLPDVQVVSSTHDEVIAIAPKEVASERLESMLEIMAQPPAWAPDLPLDAEGGHAANYCK